MHPDSPRLVMQSWNMVVPIAPQAAALFYTNLFRRDPDLRPMFRGDMEQQGQRLMSMIGMAVGRLNNIGSLLPQLRALGQRHTGYGVRREHYGTVGAALLETLEQGLGEAFTPEVARAWTEVYTLLAGAMAPDESADEEFEATLVELA
jgi:hemoglobin-like flavoprotein